MKRRDFLRAIPAAVPVLTALPRAFAQEQPAPLDTGSPASVSPAKLARISIMTYNFTSRLKLEGQAASPNRVIELFDLPQWYVDTYGVHNIELQHAHFASTETAYLQAFRERIEKAKSQMTQINVEFGQMNLSAADPVQRYQAVDLTMRWVDHAAVLGCPRVMINQGPLSQATMAGAQAALKLMNEYGKSKGVMITVETREPRGPGRSGTGLPVSNPGGPADWELVKELVAGSGTHVNIDIGNITAPDQASLHMVLRELLPLSSGNLHIKVSPNWDLAKVVKYANNDLAYRGLFSIEVNPPLIRGVYETILGNI
jgi:sugar phosphate isomerase/epimerase